MCYLFEKANLEMVIKHFFFVFSQIIFLHFIICVCIRYPVYREMQMNHFHESHSLENFKDIFLCYYTHRSHFSLIHFSCNNA